MFDLPNAKRVRRDELLSGDLSSRSPSPQPESVAQDAQQRLRDLLNLDALLAPAQPAEPQRPSQDADAVPEDEEQEFEFRLFSAAPKSGVKDEAGPAASGDVPASAGTQKLRIRLRSPTPGAVDGEGRFLNPFRGWEYYFTTPGLLTGSAGEEEDAGAAERRRQFEEVAVSGQEMLGCWSKVSWPGCHLPWRVIRLKRQHTKLPPASKDPAAIATVCVPESSAKEPKSRKKPGKKRRIQLRKRLTEAEEAKNKETEKRTRKNRERKLKRRQKARELKAATAAASGQSQDVADAEMKDDSEASD